MHPCAGFPNITNGSAIDARFMPAVKAIFSMTFHEILLYTTTNPKHDAITAVGMFVGCMSTTVGGAIGVRGIYRPITS
ncbi:hypothetical protein [[Eubacterium] cellulosolvens]